MGLFKFQRSISSSFRNADDSIKSDILDIDFLSTCICVASVRFLLSYTFLDSLIVCKSIENILVNIQFIFIFFNH